MIEPSTFAWGGAAAIGIIAAAWSKVKGLLSRLWSMFFVTVSIRGEAARAINAHCWREFRRSPFGRRRYASEGQYVRPVKRYQVIGFEKPGLDPVLFWRGWRPILVGAGSQSMGGTSPAAPDDGEAVVTYVRGMWSIDHLIVESLDAYNASRAGDSEAHPRFFVRRLFGYSGMRGRQMERAGVISRNEPQSQAPVATATFIDTNEIRLLKWSRNDIGVEPSVRGRAMDALAFPPAVCEMVDEIRRWKGSEEWYLEKRIPWTRGWLLFGAPGTGKTSLVGAVAQDLDCPVFVFDLASMSNQELQDNWREMKQSVPCIALIEDIDGVFKGRENRLGAEGGGLTFDALLNCLSGIESASGVFKVVTTNDIASIDPALGVPQGSAGISTRPGRLDRAMELPTLDAECRRQIARRILADCLQHVDHLVREGDGDSGAQFTERCARVALAEFWNASQSYHLPAAACEGSASLEATA